MSRLDWILLIVVIVLWAPSYVWYFRHDVANWWHGRRGKREERRQQAAERAKVADELAAKYLDRGGQS